MKPSKPTVSLNKLAEYVTATPARRKAIVNDQKHPSNFIQTRYSIAREAYINCVVSNYDKTIIDQAIRDLKSKPVSSDFQNNDKENSIQALECFDKSIFPDLTNLTATPFIGKAVKEIKGVDVSVRPDIIIRGTLKGEKVIGAIKFHIIKTGGLKEEARKSAATVLHQFVEENIQAADEKIALNIILSVDIFEQKSTPAPKSFKRRKADIEACCEEYAMWWKVL